MRRSRLTRNSPVKIVNAPKNMKRFSGRRGRIFGVRGPDKTWCVTFDKPVLHRGKKVKFMVFRRHELQKLEE